MKRRNFLAQAGKACLLLQLSAMGAGMRNALGASKNTELEVIGLTHRMRMLTQRMVKLYAQIVLGTREKESAQLLKESVAVFEALLVNHASLLKAREVVLFSITSALDKIAETWPAFRSALLASPSTGAVAGVASMGDALSGVLNQTAQSPQQLMGKPTALLADAAAKQTYLSQRMAKAYYLRALKLDVAVMTEQIESARAAFAANAAILEKAPETTRAIAQQLLACNAQWAFFIDALENAERYDPAAARNNVAITSERALALLSDASASYGGL